MLHIFWMLWVTHIVSGATISQADRVCFWSNGELADNLDPCDSQADITHYCGKDDLCLDNGLCLNFGWERTYSVQGCTSKNWDTPCLTQLTKFGSGDRVRLWQCNLFDKWTQIYCPETEDTGLSCCVDTKNWFNIPNFLSIHVAKSPGLQIVGARAPGWSEGVETSPRDNENTLSTSDRINLGVGISFGVFTVLACVVALCAWQFPGFKSTLWALVFKRKTGENHDASHQPAPAGSSRNGGLVLPTNTEVQLGLYQDDTPAQMYSDSISDLIESEDGWRTSSLNAAAA